MFIIDHLGFRARIKRAERLLDDGRVHGLPKGSDIEVFPVDAFKHPLPSWMAGAGNYVVPVQPNCGLWFDWTMNNEYNTAIMPTVKGMNPITGQKTQGYGLEQYQENCPVHGTQFKDGRFCEECNYKWPPQNYVCHPNTLWWDGFRAGDGTVRQFFFTEDMLKSIPERVLGAKETVPAFGFCFYKPKTPRAKPTWVSPSRSTFNHSQLATYLNSPSFISVDVEEGCTGCGWDPHPMSAPQWSSTLSNHSSLSSSQPQTSASSQAHRVPISDCMDFVAVCQEAKTSAFLPRGVNASVDVGVGAGAKIDQCLASDSLALAEWSEEPASIMRLYFVFEDQYKEIKSKGMRDLNGDREGFLSGLPVG